MRREILGVLKKSCYIKRRSDEIPQCSPNSTQIPSTYKNVLNPKVKTFTGSSKNVPQSPYLLPKSDKNTEYLDDSNQRSIRVWILRERESWVTLVFGIGCSRLRCKTNYYRPTARNRGNEWMTRTNEKYIYLNLYRIPNKRLTVEGGQ